MSGAHKNYDYPRKKHWRRWVWNRIKERIDCPPSEAFILGLFGKDGLDIEEAERRGFRRANMVAVDRDLGAVKELRKRGVVAIHGEIHKVLSAWKGEPTIDVLLGDFCGGLTAVSKTLWPIIHKPEIFTGCIMLNVLRGRDKPAADIMKLSANKLLAAWQPDWESLGLTLPTQGGYSALTHRGAFILDTMLHHLGEYIEIFRQQRVGHDEPHRYGLGRASGETNLSYGRGAQEFLSVHGDLRACCTAYRSTTTYFDTVIFRWPLLADSIRRAMIDPYPTLFDEGKRQRALQFDESKQTLLLNETEKFKGAAGVLSEIFKIDPSYRSSMAPKVAAAKAVLTRRRA